MSTTHHVPQPYFTIVGNIGSGKSTLTQLLTKELGAQEIPADNLFEVNPFFPLHLEDRQRWAFDCELWFLHKRAELYREIPKNITTSPIVVDGGLPQSHAYTYIQFAGGYITADEWEMYQTYYSLLVDGLQLPDVVVNLQGDIPSLYQRIQQRGRDYELEFYTKAYLKELAAGWEIVLDDLRRRGVTILNIDGINNHFLTDPTEVSALAAQLLSMKGSA